MIQLKSALSASSALTYPWSLGKLLFTTWPGSVNVPPLSVTLPVQFALVSAAAVGAVQPPTALKARLSLIPVVCSQLATNATSAAVIWVSGGAAPVPGGIPWSAGGQLKSTGLVAAGVHCSAELHSLSGIMTSS